MMMMIRSWYSKYNKMTDDEWVREKINDIFTIEQKKMVVKITENEFNRIWIRFFLNVRIVFWFSLHPILILIQVFFCDSHTLDFCFWLVFWNRFFLFFCFSGYSRFSKQQLQQGKRFPILVQWLIGDIHTFIHYLSLIYWLRITSIHFFFLLGFSSIFNCKIIIIYEFCLRLSVKTQNKKQPKGRKIIINWLTNVYWTHTHFSDCFFFCCYCYYWL